MKTKQNIYYLLVLLTLISFGFFGSLSHLFSLTLITIMCVEYIRSDKEDTNSYRVSLFYLALSGCFFLFFLTSLFRSELRILFDSLGPMLPIPIIGLLLIFHNGTKIKLTSKKLSQFSQISIFFLSAIYVLLKIFASADNGLHSFHTGRLTLFSGNPIPFSFCVLGVSIFCLADWRHSNKKNKLIAFLLFLFGAYVAGFLSGTRGTLLALLLISPIIIFHLLEKSMLRLLFIIISALVIFFIFQANFDSSLEGIYINRIKDGLETLIFLENRNDSIWQRLDMWSAAISAFSKAPIFGHGIAERFAALKPYLKDPNIQYTHPHNDIFAGLISNGVIGGILVLASLMSGFVAAISAPNRNSTKLYFGLMMSCLVMVTGSVSTVLFNDISSAWLAFSTYLIWATDFNDDHPRLKN